MPSQPVNERGNEATAPEPEGDPRIQEPSALPSHVTIRWEIVAAEPLLPRTALVRLFPHAVESAEVLQGVENEGKHAMPFARALLVLARRSLLTILKGILLLFLLFAGLWGTGWLVGHSVGMAVLAYGLAAWLTIILITVAATYFLKDSILAREEKLRNMERAGFLSLPLLMYATACPTTTVFLIPDASAPPGFMEWLVFYGYMFLNILSVGALEGLFGDLAAFQPPSLFAALSTFWVETLMLIGVVGAIFGTIQKALASSHTFIGTVGELRSWAKSNLGKTRDRYFVRARAVEKPFKRTAPGAPLEAVRDVTFPEWVVRTDGSLSHIIEASDYDVSGYMDVFSLFAILFGMTDSNERVRNKVKRYVARDREKSKLARKPKVVRWLVRSAKICRIIIGALALVSIVVGVVATPAFLLLFFAFDLQLGLSVSIAILAAILLIHVAFSLSNRRTARRFIRLSQIYNDALYGDESSTESTSQGVLMTAWRRIRRLAVRRHFRSIDKSESPGAKPDKGLQPPDVARVITADLRKTIWVLHRFPLAAQGNLKRVVYDHKRGQFIFIGRDDTEELLDNISFKPGYRSTAAKCTHVVTLWCANKRWPSRADQVQKVPLSLEIRPKSKEKMWSPELYSSRVAAMRESPPTED